MQIHWTKIHKIIDETPEVKTFYLQLPEGFTWEEGSFTHMGLKGFNEGDKPNRGLVRHMSISTLPDENSIGITTRIKEQCSEYKAFLKEHKIGDEVALFKTHCNVPLRRENKNIYFLSSGVGLATFRPLVLHYFDQQDGITHIHSLNIDSTKDYLFPSIFKTNKEKNFTATFVDNRPTYYEEVKQLAEDKDGIFYVVGSDEFLRQNINVLMEQGIKPDQIMLDKRESIREEFLPANKTL
ncbi:FAD-dependent oxidoreductase [Pseudogracilibacillus sp. ICA-222130]|uniref:FAD-dependent oxidoreductase n=1 Tax=Pseudogracilibacillus sp. ICA-222130 TaxID=3134655 RepID=UPI0030BE9D74